jgi:putative heme-binding domain-containing protein
MISVRGVLGMSVLSGLVATSVVVTSGLAASQTAPQNAPQKMTPEQILDYHTKDEKGGSAEAGQPLFDKLCASCHRFGAIGKDVGPDLTTIVSRFKKRDVLEAILWPSKVISDQYQSEMFELQDGKIVTGVIVRETAVAVQVRTAENPDKPVAVPKAQIANRATSTASLMPEGLLEGLSQAQTADLLAFVMAPPPAKAP